MNPPLSIQHNRLQGMDGIRAIACLLVLLSHLNKVIQRLSPGDDLPFSHNGLTGVTMFFVLSGFLITRSLLTRRNEGRIRLGNFYMRRVLRIFPLYFFYLTIAMAAVILIYPEELKLKILLYYIFFCPNVPWILSIGLPNLHHYWSLGVEEQFYMVWPIVFLGGHKRLMYYGLLTWFAFFTLKLYLITLPVSPFRDSLIYTMGYQHIMIGCCGALLQHQYARVVQKLCRYLAIEILCWLILIALLSHQITFGMLSMDAVAILTMIIIFQQSAEGKKLIKLDRPILNFIGTLSFGIYVYHPLIISIVKRLAINLGLDEFNRGFLIALFILAVTSFVIITSYLSYHFLEKTFLKKKRFFPLSTNH